MMKKFPTRADGVIVSLDGIEIGDKVCMKPPRIFSPILICIRLTPKIAIFARVNRPEFVWGFYRGTALQVGYSKHTKYDVMTELFNLK